MKKAICCGVIELYCDVAPGFNFQIGHFWHLNRVERKKVTLRCIIYDSEYNAKGPARLCSTISAKPTIQENVASSVSVEKKNQIALILQRLKTRKSRYFSSSSSCGWASSSDGLDVDGVDFKSASGVIIQDQQTLYSFWCTM